MNVELTDNIHDIEKPNALRVSNERITQQQSQRVSQDRIATLSCWWWCQSNRTCNLYTYIHKITHIHMHIHMHACMYAFIHIYIHINIHMHIYTCTYTHTHTHICIYIYKNQITHNMHACMYACIYACMCVCKHVCMSVCTYVCMSACMYACVYVCMRVCVCMEMKQIHSCSTQLWNHLVCKTCNYQHSQDHQKWRAGHNAL